MSTPDILTSVILEVYGERPVQARTTEEVLDILSAHLGALEEAGFVLLKAGSVPPWMTAYEEPHFDTDADDWVEGDCYRLSPVSKED